jgi:hypothetical protein
MDVTILTGWGSWNKRGKRRKAVSAGNRYSLFTSCLPEGEELLPDAPACLTWSPDSMNPETMD